MKKTNEKSFVRLSTVTCMAVIALVATLFTSSCQKEDSDSCTKWDTYGYLDISAEAVVSDMTKWSDADMEAMRQANKRTTIKKGEDGLYFIEEKSAEELNISPRLYAVSQRIIDNTNNFLLRKALEMSHVPLTKSSSNEGGGGGDSSPSDCVAQTISVILALFGQNVSPENINTSLEAKYGAGKGVPVDKYIEELEGYFKGREVTVDNIPSNYTLNNSTTAYLLAIKYTGGGGHAAPVESVLNDWFVIKDIQNQFNGEPMMVHKSEVVKVYKATDGL